MTHRRATLSLCLTLAAGAAAAAPADPSGTWLTQDGRARVRIEACGPGNARACGYVVWMQKPDEGGTPRLDARNPEAGKRARPVLGLQLLEGLRPNADDRYEGEIYNADDGKKYAVTVWRDGRDGLSVKGCLVAFLCSTQAWKRVDDVAPGQLAAATGAPGGPRPEPAYARTGQAAVQPAAARRAARPAPRPEPAAEPAPAE